MNILTLGSDRGLFLGCKHPTAQRFIEYSKRLDWIGTVVYTERGTHKKIDLNPSCTIYPSDSRSRFFYILDALKICSEIIRNKRIDAVVAQDTFIFGLTGYLLKKRFKIPLVVHFHADFLKNSYWLKESSVNYLLEILGFFVARRADVIRAVSTRIANNIVKAGIEKKRIFYATPPVEAESFIKRDLQEERALISHYELGNRKIFLFVGRLCKQKNLPMLFRAVAKIKHDFPEVKVLLVGDGPERKALENLARRLSLDGIVVFVGNVPNDKLKSFIRIAQALILCSFYEGTAKVIKEAAFAGTPTICTDISGADDVVIHGKTGFIIPVGNITSLSGAMERFLRENDLSEKMGQTALQFMQVRFNYAEILDSIVAIWKSAPGIVRKYGLK